MCVLLSLLFLPGALISSRTAMGERPDHLGNFNEKNTYMVGIPLSPSTMYVDHPNDNRLVAFQNDIGNRKRSNTSFQITSVTVQGSRTNTEDFEDSADDFEESHTDDISSDILDSSKFTEPDGYHSEDNTNPNNDDLSPSCGPMIITPLTPVTKNESSGMNVGLGIDMSSPFPAIGPGMVNSGVTMMTSSLESPVSAQVPIMSPLLDNWQHRFKVVKIVSSEPFKRGRWVCMDFKDPPTAENSSRCSLPAIHVTPSSFDSRGSEEQLNVQNAIAHVFEIPASSAYADAVPIHSQPIQQFYGILLPQSNNDNGNNNNNPTAVMENIPILTDVNFNQIINENASQLRSHSHPLLFQTTDAAFTPGSSMVNMAFPPISNHVIQTHDKDVNGHDNIPHAVQSGDNASADADQVADDMLANLVPERIAARNNSATEDIESRFCSLANQLSLTSGLSQSPPPVLPPLPPPPAPAQNVVPNGEYIGRPRTPSLAMTRGSPPTICAAPFTAAQVAITSASVAIELPNSAASSGASTVAIDNKIEQAMDLVKSHLMFAVREEVEVLKEKITELLDRISQLEHENDILRANASPETLKQLNQSQKKFTVQQTGNSHIQNQPPSS